MNREDNGSSYRKGLGRTLLVWFMGLSLVPLMVLGIIEHFDAKDSAIRNSHHRLGHVNLLLFRQINNYHDSVISSLSFSAKIATDFLPHLTKSWKVSNLSLREYLSGNQYQKIVDEHAHKFVDLLHFLKYTDILLADQNGNVMYTLNKYWDLGDNMFDGEWSDTRLSATVKQVVKTGEFHRSDREYYEPFGKKVVSFLVMPLLDEERNVIGTLAIKERFQARLGRLLRQEVDDSDHISSYLADIDGNIHFSAGEDSVSDHQKMNSEAVMDWLNHIDPASGVYMEPQNHLEAYRKRQAVDGYNHHHDDDDDSDNQSEQSDDGHSETMDDRFVDHFKIYNNYRGDKVLGVYRHMSIMGVPMLLLTEMRFDDAFISVMELRDKLFMVLIVTGLLILLLSFMVTRRIVAPLVRINDWVNRVASGEYVKGEVIEQNNEIGQLSRSFIFMMEQLHRVKANNASRDWLQSGFTDLNKALRGDLSMTELCENTLSFICRYLKFQMGAMYVFSDKNQLVMMGSYAYNVSSDHPISFDMGEGLPGQVAKEGQTICFSVSDDYFLITSGLGRSRPDRVLVIPIIFDGNVTSVLEFALLGDIEDDAQQFIDGSLSSIGIVLNRVQARERVQNLLKQTTMQANELIQKQDDLRIANQELEHKTRVLSESEEELRSQSEELQQANTELEEKTESMFRQKAEIEIKNVEAEEARNVLIDKAKELEEASRYKSEFLANMSHELRTPLNSMLILASMLADNDEGNLTEDDVESATVINTVGHDLLHLINDILDLSKVEAGKLVLNYEDVLLESIERQMNDQLGAVAKDKGLEYISMRTSDLPEYIYSDGQRLMQIIKNLLSNAIKFTGKGSVTFKIFKVGEEVHFSRKSLKTTSSVIGFSVKDTGIGISPDKQASIFEAFQQADGSTSRTYGGTGLGLSISREMSVLLGGEMQIVSEEGQGATFTLYVPDIPKSEVTDDEGAVVSEGDIVILSESDHSSEISHASEVEPAKEPDKEPVVDIAFDGSDRPLLIVDDDKTFASILKKVAENSGFQCVIAHSGREALDIAKRTSPQAVMLDLGLPDMDGETVLEQLKQQAGSRSMPIHIISGREIETTLLNKGATALLKKPVSEKQLVSIFDALKESNDHDIHKVLIIDADEENRVKTIATLSAQGIEAEVAINGHDLREALNKKHYHCLIMDIDLPDEDGTVLLHELQEQLGDDMPQVIINTARKIDREEHRELSEFARTMVMKGEHSEDRLMDEVNLFLHSIQSENPKRLSAKPALSDDSALKGRKILLVDDDLRNTFALSKALQKYHLDIVLADNGELALEQLEKQSDIELVLMDIMMPVMDGYEATRRIRANPRFNNLPVIALTAKAMSDDRAKCIEAGANDYMTKPIDMDKMVAMLKLWLQQKSDDIV
ncbi:MAG: response regulator [Endozoicomonadaceae bacterium]|nr:response regulator [Endozoicomonadaceae bacterium]